MPGEGPRGNGNSDWIKPIASAFSAVALMAAGVWAVGISPLRTEIDKLIIGREKDGDQLAKLYTSIQTNDEYKLVVDAKLDAIRAEITRSTATIIRIEEEQKRRSTAVASVESLEKRIDRLDEQDRRSAPTVLDEIKQLRGELETMRQRIMVPMTAPPPTH